eukprot:293812-Prymnesium_polylepis.1
MRSRCAVVAMPFPAEDHSERGLDWSPGRGQPAERANAKPIEPCTSSAVRWEQRREEAYRVSEERGIKVRVAGN